MLFHSLRRGGLIALLLVLFLPSLTAWPADKCKSPLGNTVHDFQLRNCYGKEVSLSDFADAKAIAIVYLGTECPLAKLYGPRLEALSQKYAEQGVQIIGINSNTQDGVRKLQAYVHRHEIKFPMLKDPGNRVADAMGAERTPEAFLLDQQRKVVYHGRIDNQYGVGYAREHGSVTYLANAIDELLAGAPVSTASTEPEGCFIGKVSEQTPVGPITYTKHIAPILNARCVSCHRDGEIAPFTLKSYDDVLGWEDTILEVIADKRMPPWNAKPGVGHFANDPSLTKEEIKLLQTWVDNGMPEGDPADLPAPPTFADGWRIDAPDEVLFMNEEKRAFQVPAEGVVDYERFVVDPGWTEDKYITAAEARPDCREVVHHILVYVIPPGDKRMDINAIVAGYAPGSAPTVLPEGVAIEVKAGSKLLFEMHYTPNGSKQDDLSYVGVRFMPKEKVSRLLRGAVAIDRKFRIPPRDPSHEVVAYYQSKRDDKLISMTPHMHLRGKSFRYDIKAPGGTWKPLLDVPTYDFNWQLKYIPSEPIPLPVGTVIRCTAIFDNSDDNVSNPDSSKEVGWGDQSFNEMMIGFMEVIPVEEDFKSE